MACAYQARGLLGRAVGCEATVEITEITFQCDKYRKIRWNPLWDNL